MKSNVKRHLVPVTPLREIFGATKRMLGYTTDDELVPHMLVSGIGPNGFYLAMSENPLTVSQKLEHEFTAEELKAIALNRAITRQDGMVIHVAEPAAIRSARNRVAMNNLLDAMGKDIDIHFACEGRKLEVWAGETLDNVTDLRQVMVNKNTPASWCTPDVERHSAFIGNGRRFACVAMDLNRMWAGQSQEFDDLPAEATGFTRVNNGKLGITVGVGGDRITYLFDVRGAKPRVVQEYRGIESPIAATRGYVATQELTMGRILRVQYQPASDYANGAFREFAAASV